MTRIHFLNVQNGDCSIIEHDSGRISVIDVCCARKLLLEQSYESFGVVKGNFNLTGDSGLRGLGNALETAKKEGISIKDSVTFYQIPHHGSRHNVSPSLLNKLLGEIKDEGNVSTKIAVASVCKGSAHPLKVVTNAFIRRGVKTYSTKDGNIVSHSHNLPSYDGWTSLKADRLSEKVEKWD